MSAQELGEFKQALRRKSVEEIESEYTAGYLEAGDKNYMLREKARVTLEDMIESRGVLASVWQKTIDNFMEGWENVKEAATRELPEDTSIGSELYYSGQAMWGQVQMLFSAMTAIGEITGSQAEKFVLQWGASPGAARVIGIAADIGSGFMIPVGIVSRAGAKAVQSIKGAKGAKEAGSAAKAIEAVQDEARAMRAIAEGLEIDGVKKASKLLEDSVKSTKPDVADSMKRAREVVEKIEDLAKTKSASEIQVSMQGPTKLPANLAGAKPRYNFKDKTFTPEFESDIDRALYIVAQNTPSKRDKQYIEWLRSIFPGQPDADIRAMGRVIRNEIKTMAKEAKSGASLVVKSTGRIGRAETFQEEASRLAKNVTEQQARDALPTLMKKFGISFPDLKKMKEMKAPAFNAQEFYGYLKALEGRGADLTRLAKRAVAEGSTDADRIAFAQYATKLFTGLEDRVKYSKEFTNMLMHWDPASVASGDLAKAMRTFAEDMATLDKRDMGKFLLRNQDGFLISGSNWWRISRELFSNLLLPISWPAAIVGNSYATGRKIVERMAGAPNADIAIREALYSMKGMMLATGDALFAMRLAYATSGARNVIPGAFGRLVNRPRDTTIAFDAFTKVIVGRAELYAAGFREAESLGARNIGKYVNDFVANPPQAAFERAWEIAQKATYSNDLGRFSQAFTKLAQSGPGSLWFTFMKSPINLTKYAWDRTPGLQLLSKQLYDDILAGGTRAEDAIGRLTMANLEAMFWYEMAKDGFVSGTGPADPALRGSYTAIRPLNSFKTPIGWLLFDRMEPMTQPISFMADLADIRDHLDDMTAGQLMMAGTLAFVRDFANKTAWRTASDAIEMINGVARGEKLSQRDKMTLLSPGMAIATGGPLVSRTRSINDPVLRDARNLMDAWKSRVPGYSEDVPPLRDDYGDPIIPPQTLGPSWFGFFSPLIPKMQAFENDPIKQEGARLRARLPKFPDQIGLGEFPDDWDITKAQPSDPLPVKISPKQRDRWKQIYRNAIRGAGTEDNPGMNKGLLQIEAYKKAPLALQRQMFQDYLLEMKSAARDALLVEDKELGKRVIENKFENVLPLIDKEERPNVEAEIPEALNTFDAMSDEERNNLLRWGYLEPDQPKKTQSVEILGIEILGSREYTPKP